MTAPPRIICEICSRQLAGSYDATPGGYSGWCSRCERATLAAAPVAVPKHQKVNV
jgi:hypothetical protein